MGEPTATPEADQGRPAAGAGDPLRSTLARVRRRELFSKLLSIASLDLLLGLSAYAGYLLCVRVLGLPERPLLALLIALSGSTLATTVQALFTLRLSYFGAALLTDERLSLKERVSSAVYLEREARAERGAGVERGYWAELVRRDGARSLAGIDVARHFPIRIPRLAQWTLVPAALAVLLSFLPPLDLLGLRGARRAEAAMRREVDRKRDELQKAIEDLRKEAEKPPDPELEKILEALRKRPGEETSPRKEEAPLPGDDAKRDALVQMARLEEVLRKELERSQFGVLKEFLDRFPPGSLARTPLSGALREALKAGEFQKGLSELKKLKDQLAALDEKKRAGQLTKEELDRMKKLSDELSRLAQDAAALKKLSAALSGAAGGLQSGDLSQSLAGLNEAQSELASLEELLKDMKFLEEALELAQLSQEDLANLHRCPNCGKVSQDPGGT